MTIDADDEIVQDFLVEAGEILEQLNEQLVELEQKPDDSELLNAVFRGFHTIKGGASFLNLTHMVNVCHRAEDVFNLLRSGKLQVNAKLMDIVLPVLDILNNQFEELREYQDPSPADDVLLENLEKLSNSENEDVLQEDQVQEKSSSSTANVAKAPEQAVELTVAGGTSVDTGVDESSDDITDEEFEHLLNALDSNTAVTGKEASGDPKVTSSKETVEQSQIQQKVTTATVKEIGLGDKQVTTDEISEQEFDSLLDDLQKSRQQSKASVAAVSTLEKTSLASASATANKDKNSPPESKISKKNQKETNAQTETTVRVDTRRLDEIMNLVGELVLVRNRLLSLDAINSQEEAAKVVSNLDVVTADLQNAVMKTRMQPIKKVFGRFPRVVRDLARTLNKEVNLETLGEETDLDKNLVEALADPLIHLVRNAVDHGIEMPDIREANGKSRMGTVVLGAQQEGDHILLTISDDGAGMDPEALRDKAIEKGILDMDTASRMDNKDFFNLIFLPGFSIKKEISDISGRGVGMDVVKNRISQLNGAIDIDSTLGKGSRLTIKVPLTLAIMPTLMVMIKKQIFALPLVNVSEIFHLDLTKTNVIDGQVVVMVREKALPLFYLRHWLINGALSDAMPKEGHVVVVSVGAQKVGFIVDQLIGQEEVVIKPLGAMLQGTKGVAGATITGDGRISLILDVPELMMVYARKM